MSKQYLPTKTIPLLHVPERTNGNAIGKSSEGQMRISLDPNEWATVTKVLEPSIGTIAEPFWTTYSRDINLAHSTIVEGHLYKINGQGPRGRPPIASNDKMQQGIDK